MEKRANARALAAELKRLQTDDVAYQAFFAWKLRPPEQLNPKFVTLVRDVEAAHFSERMCAKIEGKFAGAPSPPARAPLTVDGDQGCVTNYLHGMQKTH